MIQVVRPTPCTFSLDSRQPIHTSNPKIRRWSTFFSILSVFLSFLFFLSFFFLLLPPFCLSPLSLVGRISFHATLGAKKIKEEERACGKVTFRGCRERWRGGAWGILWQHWSPPCSSSTQGRKKKIKDRKKVVIWRSRRWLTGATQWILSVMSVRGGTVGLQSDSSAYGCWQINPWGEEGGQRSEVSAHLRFD